MLRTLAAPTRVDVRGNRYGLKEAGALQAFRAALAGRGTAPCNVGWLGDSTDEGTGAGTLAADRAKSAPDRFAEALRNLFPTAGEAAVQAPNFVPVNTAGPGATGFTKGGTWTASTQYGPNANAARSQGAGNTLTYVVPAGTTAFDVLSVGGGSITGFTVAIDGGAASATQAISGSIRDGVTSRFTVDPATSHSVVITSVGTNNYIHGLLLYAGNESKGIRVFNAGKHGTRSDQWINGGSYNWMPASPSPTQLGGIQSLMGLNPDLLVIGWGVNDYSSTSPTVSAAQSRANSEAVVAAVRAVLPSKLIPVVFLGKWTPSVAQGGPSTWAQFREQRALAALADPLGINVDLATLMPDVGSAAATTLALYADTTHAVAKGYQMEADALQSLLAP